MVFMFKSSWYQNALLLSFRFIHVTTNECWENMFSVCYFLYLGRSSMLFLLILIFYFLIVFTLWRFLHMLNFDCKWFHCWNYIYYSKIVMHPGSSFKSLINKDANKVVELNAQHMLKLFITFYYGRSLGPNFGMHLNWWWHFWKMWRRVSLV